MTSVTSSFDVVASTQLVLINNVRSPAYYVLTILVIRTVVATLIMTASPS